MDTDTLLASIGPLVMGGAGFSYQLDSTPETTPLVDIIKTAFDSGITAIDTSPYYEPSEQLIGAALNTPDITSRYSRDQYFILTKAGRISATHSDYSPSWIRKSVNRSLERFRTDYLDIVFAHDVELVEIEEAVTAVGVLFQLADTGSIRLVGISGYDIDVLYTVATLSRERYGRCIDVIQTWAQLTLQNGQLQRHGFDKFRAAGVRMVFCSSPLAIGLLRTESVPVGRLGDWHPAPHELRLRAQRAAEMVAQHGDDLASLALRYALRKAQQNSTSKMLVSTICGIDSLSQLTSNIVTAKTALRRQELGRTEFAEDTCKTNELSSDDQDERLCVQVKTILGPWVDYDFSTKTMAGSLAASDDIGSSTESEIVSARL